MYMTPKHVAAIQDCIIMRQIGVMNEYFSQDARNKQCQKVTAVVLREAIRVLVIRRPER